MTEVRAARSGRDDARDVVFTFSYESWDDAVARGMMRPPDRLVSRLLESDRVSRLLVANPWRWYPSAEARTLLGRHAPFPTDDRHVLHSPLRWRRADAPDIPGVERDYIAYDASLAGRARRMSMQSPAVITANPLVAGFAPLSWADGVTYFGRDDWTSSPSRQAYWPAYREAYRRIADSGAAVAVVSQQILDRIAPTGPAAVVPNGVEVAEWTGDVPTVPDWFDRIPAPRATYVGTLDSRLDVVGLVALAERRPELQIVLIGPLPDATVIAPLRSLPNVHVHGLVGRRDVVAVLRASEVCLLAHRRTPLTEAMSPLKVYEYLAAGAPVVSIDLPPVRLAGDGVFFADTVADFADVVDEALRRGRTTEADRLAFVERNSWASRHEVILDLALGRSPGRETRA